MHCSRTLRQTGCQVIRSKKRPIFWILLSEDVRPERTVCLVPAKNFHSLNDRSKTRRPLLNVEENGFQFYRIPNSTSRRGIGMIAVKILKNVLKIRYLLLGGAIGGGYSLQKMYQDWINGLPDLSWMDRYIPKNEDWDAIRDSFSSFRDRVTQMEIDPQLREVAEDKMSKMKTWLEMKLEEAKLAADQLENERANDDNAVEVVSNAVTINALSFGKEKESKTEEVKGSRITEEDLWENEMKYQKELERLERENKELRQQLLLRYPSSQSSKKVRVSLIDMYSDVLDELTDYDVNYKTQDHLPRVVVIGDQSSGKTSVLEMIAQARIFPRGAGEMMTRTPVKVTLSEGPYHIAQFKGSSREFDLTKEADLADLRREVELRMRNLTKTQTVSNDVISMTVKGPGLQRMVLVDLPGIISTNTLNMAKETKEAIYQIAKHYMSNPNAIILCIQDGSVDAERSNVTDLVSQMDPNGKRTIFVLTKVDLAEQNFTNPERIKKILAGELFPMKALGYFAVITGRGATNESIDQIKRYEEEFFRKSTVFGGKVVKSNRLTTRNLSLAVSDCFWKMVRETVEQQADAFKAQRFNLETEWKNKFPRQRILDRNELFEKARGEMLDEIMKLGEIPVKVWDDSLSSILWRKVSDFVFEKIFLTAAQSSQKGGEFNTQVDILLNQWAEQQLPQISVDAGWETLQREFKALIEPKTSQKNQEQDDIFDSLKLAVLDELLKRHKWEEKATEILRVLQLNTLADQTITDKQQWDAAVKFLETSMKEKYVENEKYLRELFGPSWWDRWVWWQNCNDAQKQRNAVRNELEKIIYNDREHSAILSEDELTTVRNTLQRSNVSCDNDLINSTWSPLYRKYFLKRTLEKIPDFMRGFYIYKQGLDVQDYKEVVLYWRIQQTLKVTVNSLRQQIMNREALRIDKEVDDVLEEFSRSQEKKEQLLTGRRVTLAEELKRVKQIQEKLEEFIKALNKEKLESRRP